MRRWGGQGRSRSGVIQTKAQLACVRCDHFSRGSGAASLRGEAAAESGGSSEARVGAGSESTPLDFLLTGDPDFPEGRLILEKTAKQGENMCSRFQVQGYDGCLLDERILPLRFSTAGGRHLGALLGLGFLLRSLLHFVP